MMSKPGMDDQTNRRTIRRLRVALVIDTLRGGGAERSILNVARGMTDRGHSVDLVTFADGVAYKRELSPQIRLFRFNLRQMVWHRRRIERFRVLWSIRRKLFRLMKSRDQWAAHPYIEWKLLRLLRGRRLDDVRALVEYIDREEPDCILPSLSRAKISTLLARSLSVRNPVVIPIVHNVMMNRRKRIQDRYRLLFPLADHLVAVSRGAGESLAQHLGLSVARITCIYNPVDIGFIERLADERVDHPWMTDGGAPTVVTAGRLAPAKDHRTLLKALAEAQKRRPIRLIILGEGPCREALESLVFELGLEDKVSLPGWVENPFSFMGQASAFVLSSRWEGLGNVLIEALALGCACVSTDCPSGPAEILDHGRVGPLVPVGDHMALAEAICNVLANPPDIERLKAQAAKFSFEKSIDDYERLITGVLRNSKDSKTS